MNKHRFRIIFNRARGMLMAVAEIATVRGKRADDRDGVPHDVAVQNLAFVVKTVSAAVCLALGLIVVIPAQAAGIVAAPSAPASQRPTVLNASNGVPLVNIQTPSAAGVSRNTYTQFDVSQQGVILNNARTNAQTQLGGWVQGNPWLAGGTARVILNEVNSNNPSLLQGYIEIAGSRAQVVIANPAGVTCDGCGFINANRATITTGSPIVNGGNLDGYLVRGGVVTVQGNGMDASTTDYADIIARAVQVNAGLWANSLNVTAGAGQVDAANTTSTPVPGMGSAPAFAVDVAALGGMYAGKITLVGTEAGVGVRNAGTLEASAGQLIVTVDGRLENSGSMTASGNANLATTGDIDNSGTVYAQGNTALTTQGNITNSGMIAALGNAGITANGASSAIQSTAGAVMAAGLRADGTLGNAGHLTATATLAIAAHGQNLAGGDQNITAQSLDLGDSQTIGRNLTLTTANGNLNMADSTIAASGILAASTTQTLATDGAQVSANQLNLAAHDLRNVAGSIVQTGNGDTNINLVGMLDNSQGLISSTTTLNLVDHVADAGSNVAGKTLAVTNTGGTIIAGAALTIDSASLTGDGRVLSHGDLITKLTSNYTHTGEWQATGNATFITTGTLANRASLLAGNTLEITAGTLDNQASGSISASITRLAATDTHTLTNRGLIDGSDTFIDTITLNNIGTGRIYGDHVAIAATTLTNDSETVNSVTTAGVIAARDRLDIGAGSITNREHALLFSAGDMAIGGTLDANHQAMGQATTLDNNSATIEALGHLAISAATLNNTNEHFASGASLSSSTSFNGYDMGQWCSALYAMPGCTGNYIEDHTEHTYTRETYVPVVTQSDPGQLLAGGNLTLTGNTLTNDKSRIIAGGNLTGDLANLSNLGAEATQQDVLTDHYRVWQGGGDDWYRDTGTHVITTNSTVTLPVTQTLSHTAPSGSGTQVAALASTSVNQTVAGALTHTITLPNNSLFHANPSPSSHYLIETDPAFASYRTWLSSDFMLAQLGLDPALTQKRLGDGFYEQRLVREQVAQLTGRRFLDGYASDEAEYQALMNAGATFAKTHQLIPGVALTEAQMAQLTSDIVWLLEKSVTLADGSAQQVLVPQLYVRPQDGDIDGSGTLLAGENVNLRISGDLTNRNATIAGRTVVALTAENIRNLGGRITGNSTDLAARTDLANTGGRLEGRDWLSVAAGRNLTVETTTATADNVTANSQFSRTTVDRVAGLYVSNPNGILVASAGNDLHLLGANVRNSEADGKITLAAGRDLKLGTVTEAELNSQTWGARNYGHLASTHEVGTSIKTSGDLTLTANRDLSARAANVTSDAGAITAVAGNDLTIATGTATRNEDTARYGKKSGFLSSTSKASHDTLDEKTAIASTFSGDTVDLQAGHDLTVSGSNVVSTHGTTLAAKNDVAIEAATQASDETHAYQKSKSGVFASGNSLTLGRQKLKTTNDSQTVSNLGSTVGSTDGSVSIIAGSDYAQTGSNVLAPKGDIDITAQRVDINAATDTYANQQSMKFKQSGLSVSISGGSISAMQNFQQESKGLADSTTGMGRVANLLALADDATAVKSGVTGVMQGYEKDGIAGAVKGSGLSFNVSLGTSKSSSQSSSSSTAVVGSRVQAGGDINVTATGAGNNSDITIQGSGVNAGHDVHLTADDAINLVAAKNAAAQQSSNESSSASVGASFGLSSNGFGLSVNGGLSKARGNADGIDTSYTNTHIDAANVLTLKSGGDTTLRGAIAEGKQVIATIGGNLNLESLQDTSSYNSKQQSVGVGISVPVIGGGAAGGSISASQAKANGDYASVVEQTGIKAGGDGFNITTQGNTDLKGAVIASSDKTVQDGKNSLITGTLTYSNMLNHTEASASSDGINLTQDLFSKYGAVRTLITTADQHLNESANRSGMTRSAIEQGSINITAADSRARNISEDNAMTISRDTQNANQPVIKLDAKAMEQRVANEAQQRAADVALVTRITDDAYRVMFRETPRFYQVSCRPGDDCTANPKLARIEEVKGSPAEIQAIITKSGDTNAILAVNGIQNGIERAGELAYQNADLVRTDSNGQPLAVPEKPSTIYFMHYQPANTTVGELIVAGYEKILTQSGSTTASLLGYTNSDITYAKTLQGFGDQAVTSLGHSRGTEVQLNGFNILNQQGYTNNNLTVRGVGGAVDMQEYTDAAMGTIGASSSDQLKPDQINFSYYANDPVATMAGGNRGDSGVMALRNLWTVFTGGDHTQHSCYGTGAVGCSQVEIPSATGPQGSNNNLIQYQNGQRVDTNSAGR